MKCSNNLDKDEFWPKDNDDIMQHVESNKFLFTSRWKHWKNKETTNIIVEQKIILNVEVEDINSFLYEIEIHSMYLNSI
jgi:hypothetical protein